MSTATTEAFKLISEFEGCRLKPYLCPAHVWTIGYGNTTLPDGTSVRADTPALTQKEADLMLSRTILNIEKTLSSLVSTPLTPGQKAALISLIFNIGETAFSHSTLRQDLQNGNFVGAAEQFLLWVHAGGTVLRGLTRRRAAEREVFLSDKSDGQSKH